MSVMFHVYVLRLRFTEFYGTMQNERKSSKTPVKVIKPDDLCRVCRCSPAVFFLNLAFLGKTGLAKIMAHLTNSNPFKKRFFTQPIRFPGSNLDSGEIKGNVIGSALSKKLNCLSQRSLADQHYSL